MTIWGKTFHSAKTPAFPYFSFSLWKISCSVTDQRIFVFVFFSISFILFPKLSQYKIFVSTLSGGDHPEESRTNLWRHSHNGSFCENTVHQAHSRTLQIFIVILLCKSIKIMGKMFKLMIGKLFCKSYHWNPGIVCLFVFVDAFFQRKSDIPNGI